MTARLAGIALVLGCLLLLHSASADEADLSAPSASAAAGGEVAPYPVMNFSLLDYHGRHHELRRANAQVVVLYFTGFRCPMAKQGVPKLKKLEAAYRSKGVAVWLVNATPQDDPNDTMVAAIGQLGAEGKLDRFVPKSAENADTLNRIGAMSSLADTMPRNLLLGDPANLRRQVLRSVMGPLTVLRDDKQLVAHYFGVTRTCETIAIDTKNSRVIYRGALDDQRGGCRVARWKDRVPRVARIRAR